jgi:hypothetical protein
MQMKRALRREFTFKIGTQAFINLDGVKFGRSFQQAARQRAFSRADLDYAGCTFAAHGIGNSAQLRPIAKEMLA